MYVCINSSRPPCAECGEPVVAGSACVVAEDGARHLACGARRDAAGVHRALLACGQELPELASALGGTEVLRVRPPPVFLDEGLPRTASAAEARWRELVPPAPVDDLLRGLTEGLPAATTWPERYRSWQQLVQHATDPRCDDGAAIRDLVIVLRTLDPFRDHLAGLSYAETRLWDEALGQLEARAHVARAALLASLDRAVVVPAVPRHEWPASSRVPLDATLAGALLRVALVAELAPGPARPDGSRWGGRPWTSPDAPTPTLDGDPMPLLLQLDLAELPGSRRAGLLQVFHDPDAAFDDAAPWTASKVVRVIDPANGALGDWDASRAAPALAVARWNRVEELPDADTLRALGIEPATPARPLARGLKIGGWPAWIQGDAYPPCRDTRLPCGYVLQLPSHPRFGTDFGGRGGTAWVFESPLGPLTMTWQC